MRYLFFTLALIANIVTSQNLSSDSWVFSGLPDDLPIITSTLPAGSISQIQNQTLTFTFAAPVSDFDASDVTLTGAIKGRFNSVSPTVYTLDILGTGGTISASVGQRIDSPISTTASFSNFYQDTWKLILQDTPTSVTMELIRVPAGTYLMGSASSELSRFSNETQHIVTLTQDFYIGKTEVTQEQWKALESIPESQTQIGDRIPVHNVSYYDILLWLQKLNSAQFIQGTFSLPTEAQWEYACRAGTTTRFNFGDGFGADEKCSPDTERISNMWYCGNNTSFGTPTYGMKAVSQKPANAWGLYDMHGNVSEWCLDWDGSYPATAVTDPTGPQIENGTYRIVRGGSWLYNALACRSSQRLGSLPNNRSNQNGFRVMGFRKQQIQPPSQSVSITSTLAAGSVSQTQYQTLTYTFDEPVTGFDFSDITVTGAYKGTFTQISSTVYTIELIGTGGTVFASLEQNVVSPNNDAATFSNFYQDTWTIMLPDSVPMELLRIPAGTFIMGSPFGHYQTQHKVTLTQDFYLGKTEVTQNQWAALQPFPIAQNWVGGTKPVHKVSYNDILSWMRSLDEHVTETAIFSLPTESQWEYACRAGTTTRFNFGDAFGTEGGFCSQTPDTVNNMWYCGNNSPYGMKPVGQKLPNAWGLHDMHGNAREWCADLYGTYPSTVTDPTGPVDGSNPVIRGGDWFSNVLECQSAVRSADFPTYRSSTYGFRVLALRPTPITISSTIPPGAITQTQNQTLTFTFETPVTGFDSSDITLIGATKGTFSGSGTTYTLDITGTGGTISASIPQNVVSPINPPASFSNFYQDTWTLILKDSPTSITMELIRIPAGSFTMGSPPTEVSREINERQHFVTLTQDFYLGKTEVTQEQWSALQSFPKQQAFLGEDMPVHNVSHNDVIIWMKLLNMHNRDDGIFALPTEAQWEYACRAGTTTRFNFGESLGANNNCSTEPERVNNMWYCGNNGIYDSPTFGTKKVALKPSNSWGLHDMHGNVWEWCADWKGDYPGAVTDPAGPYMGSDRIFRGGSYLEHARLARSATRYALFPSARYSTIGFRVAATR